MKGFQEKGIQIGSKVQLIISDYLIDEGLADCKKLDKKINEEGKPRGNRDWISYFALNIR